jgi:hypothetical protein
MDGPSKMSLFLIKEQSNARNTTKKGRTPSRPRDRAPSLCRKRLATQYCNDIYFCRQYDSKQISDAESKVQEQRRPPTLSTGFIPVEARLTSYQQTAHQPKSSPPGSSRSEARLGSYKKSQIKEPSTGFMPVKATTDQLELTTQFALSRITTDQSL